MYYSGIDQHKRDSFITTYDSNGTVVKTDKVDSDILALLLQAGLIPEAHKISTNMRGPRDLMRSRLRLISKCAS